MCFQPLFTNFIYLLLSLFKKKKTEEHKYIPNTAQRKIWEREIVLAKWRL